MHAQQASDTEFPSKSSSKESVRQSNPLRFTSRQVNVVSGDNRPSLNDTFQDSSSTHEVGLEDVAGLTDGAALILEVSGATNA